MNNLLPVRGPHGLPGPPLLHIRNPLLRTRLQVAERLDGMPLRTGRRAVRSLESKLSAESQNNSYRLEDVSFV
jgi:hypothetical protein